MPTNLFILIFRYINKTIKVMKLNINYWMQYLGEDYSTVNQIEVDSIIRAAIDDWNKMADGEENLIKSEEFESIYDFSYSFYNQSGGYLDIEVIQSYITQEL